MSESLLEQLGRKQADQLDETVAAPGRRAQAAERLDPGVPAPQTTERGLPA